MQRKDDDKKSGTIQDYQLRTNEKVLPNLNSNECRPLWVFEMKISGALCEEEVLWAFSVFLMHNQS